MLQTPFAKNNPQHFQLKKKKGKKVKEQIPLSFQLLGWLSISPPTIYPPAVIINYAYQEDSCRRRNLQPRMGNMGFPSSVRSLRLHWCCRRPVSWLHGVWSTTDAVRAVTRLLMLRHYH